MDSDLLKTFLAVMLTGTYDSPLSYANDEQFPSRVLESGSEIQACEDSDRMTGCVELDVSDRLTWLINRSLDAANTRFVIINQARHCRIIFQRPNYSASARRSRSKSTESKEFMIG